MHVKNLYPLKILLHTLTLAARSYAVWGKDVLSLPYPQAFISRDVVREVFVCGDAGTLSKKEKRWKQLEKDVGRNTTHSLRAV